MPVSPMVIGMGFGGGGHEDKPAPRSRAGIRIRVRNILHLCCVKFQVSGRLHLLLSCFVDLEQPFHLLNALALTPCAEIRLQSHLVKAAFPAHRLSSCVGQRKGATCEKELMS